MKRKRGEIAGRRTASAKRSQIQPVATFPYLIFHLTNIITSSCVAPRDNFRKLSGALGRHRRVPAAFIVQIPFLNCVPFCEVRRCYSIFFSNIRLGNSCQHLRFRAIACYFIGCDRKNGMHEEWRRNVKHIRESRVFYRSTN